MNLKCLLYLLLLTGCASQPNHQGVRRADFVSPAAEVSCRAQRVDEGSCDFP